MQARDAAVDYAGPADGRVRQTIGAAQEVRRRMKDLRFDEIGM